MTKKPQILHDYDDTVKCQLSGLMALRVPWPKSLTSKWKKSNSRYKCVCTTGRAVAFAVLRDGMKYVIFWQMWSAPKPFCFPNGISNLLFILLRHLQWSLMCRSEGIANKAKIKRLSYSARMVNLLLQFSQGGGV